MKFIMLQALLFSLSAFSFTPPDFTVNVVDEAAVLSETDLTDLHQSIQSARDKADIWTAVYIVPSTNGISIEEAAESTFKKWKLGKEGKDNGLLFMIAVNDRKMRIEVGYGLEGSIPDAIAHHVVENTLKPNFKSNNFGLGISEGIGRLVSHRLKEEVINPDSSSDIWENPRLIGCIALNFFLVSLFWVLFLFRMITGRKYKLRWFGPGLLGGHAAAIFFTLFFSLFWIPTEFPLYFIAPFNAVFALTFGGVAMFRPLQLLLSTAEYASWVAPWITYDDQFKKWKAEFKAAEKEGTLVEFLKLKSPPEKPNSLFGKFSKTSGWRTTFSGGSSSGFGSSGSSSRSSSSSSRSSSSSSSGAGRSGGGGSSGSW